MRGHALLIVFSIFFSSIAAQANSIGTDAQNFNPSNDGVDFVTVQSGETLGRRIVNFGLFFNYAINTLPFFRTDIPANQAHTDFNDSLLYSDINIGFGVTDKLEFGISLPALLSQQIDQVESLGSFENRGVTEIRLMSKYQFARKNDWSMAVVPSINFNRIENNPFVGIDGGPIFNLELALSRPVDKNWAFGLNIGHRWRNRGAAIPGVGIEPFPNQALLSTALSYYWEKIDSKFIFEIFSSFPTQSIDKVIDRKTATAEFLAGIKHQYNTSLSLHAGAGTELVHGNATPDWRIYTGLNYTFGPVFSKVDANFLRREDGSVERIILSNIHFHFDSTTLTEDSEQAIADALALLKREKYDHLVVEGHTDSIGSEKYNLGLSESRADSVYKIIVEKLSVEKSKVEKVGYGESRPKESNANYQGRAINRRVEIELVKKN